MMDEATELKRIRWRSRRGMRELDRLFDRYLDQRWAQAPMAERAVFLRMLDCEDDKLWRWSMGYEVCEDEELAQLLRTIAAMPV